MQLECGRVPRLLPMQRGFSLVELAVTAAVLGLVTAIALPRVKGLEDWIAVDAAARDVTTALAVARNAAVMQGTRARLLVAADSLRIDRFDSAAWAPLARWAGPAERAVALRVANEQVIFGPTGIGFGPSNTTVVLSRGSRTATITVSRVGRVKRW